MGILLSIALFPLVAPHFWHAHFPKVSAFWAIAFALVWLGLATFLFDALRRLRALAPR